MKKSNNKKNRISDVQSTIHKIIFMLTQIHGRIIGRGERGERKIIYYYKQM